MPKTFIHKMVTAVGVPGLYQVLDDLQLSHLQENFDREKITIDVIPDLSREEFEVIGLRNETTIEILKQMCTERLSSMRCLTFDISRPVLENLLDVGFKCAEIASILAVSTRTIQRRLEMYKLSFRNFSDITDDALDKVIAEIQVIHNCGEVMLKGMLLEHGIQVTRLRLRDSIHRIDWQGSLQRRRKRLHRRTYHVEGPNCLWHIDGNHKLIRWGFVVHGGIDGYSRLPVFLKCSTNNKSSTVFKVFSEAVEQYGLPLRVRSDAGGENVVVWEFMEQARGAAGVLVGKSTHNQRIERLWRDVFSGCLQHYYQLFYLLEDNGFVNHLCPTQLFALQYVFLPRINASISAWSSAWVSHRLRTTSNTPLQLWVAGQLQNPVGMDDQSQHDMGVEDDDIPDAEIPQVVLEEPEVPLAQDQYQQLRRELDPMRASTECGVDVFMDVLHFVETQYN